MKALLISPESWSHIHVSKHHYAIELANQGHQVFFLNPPTNKFFCRPTEFQNLLEIDYKGFWSGLYRLPKFLRLLNQRHVLSQLEKLTGCVFDLVWSFDNSVFYDMEVFGDAFKISHIVDLNQDFQTARAATSADLCLGVIPSIVERLSKYNANTHLMRHGVHIYPCTSKVELPGTSKTKALYFGNLAMPHLDWELLEQACRGQTNTDFILLGSGGECIPHSVAQLSNVYILDAVPSDKLMCYMEASDVLLLFYTPAYYRNYASPHKLMEYLSSGKPIVASYTEDYSPYDHLIFMDKTNSGWLANLSRLIELGDNPEFVIKRKELAVKYTYSRQLFYILRLSQDVSN